MEFTLMCPNDGRVELSLEDISAVVFRGPESVEVVFLCPRCGTSLRASMQVPNLLATAMELAQMSEDGDAGAMREIRGRADLRADGTETKDAEAELRARREKAGEPYCEYFRRQLARIECVEDLLAELGN